MGSGLTVSHAGGPAVVSMGRGKGVGSLSHCHIGEQASKVLLLKEQGTAMHVGLGLPSASRYGLTILNVREKENRSAEGSHQ